jgi:hypothetical protein
MMSKQVRPYLMDLGSTNGTFINENRIEPSRYYELFEKDTIKFGNSRYDQLKKASLFCLFVYCSMYMYLWYVMT